MSHPTPYNGAMKSKSLYCPVILEPELEEEAALLTPSQRVDLAGKFERWARQLRVSAYILRRRHAPKTAGNPKSLKPIGRRKTSMN